MSDPVARNCLKNTTRQLSQLTADGALEECQCPLTCYETGYECESNDALCMEKYRINAAMIQVFYEELNYPTLTESPAYSMTSLIADLGGLSGLWIGISVVSILEVVQLIWFCMQYIHKKKTPELLAMVRSARKRSSAGHTDKSPSGSFSSHLVPGLSRDLRPAIRITQHWFINAILGARSGIALHMFVRCARPNRIYEAALPFPRIKALEHEADMEHGQADGGAATVPHAIRALLRCHTTRTGASRNGQIITTLLKQFVNGRPLGGRTKADTWRNVIDSSQY
ncbi:hypothetical protein niasHT_033652 [Heterodera trifolii]|uniref:Uncharacterized protein n=1 Tax=Heterodera trifolii TaxID=157864 RepID=A0ABD2IBM1_9BILA